MKTSNIIFLHFPGPGDQHQHNLASKWKYFNFVLSFVNLEIPRVQRNSAELEKKIIS